jgi:hypothetical protein
VHWAVIDNRLTPGWRRQGNVQKIWAPSGIPGAVSGGGDTDSPALTAAREAARSELSQSRLEESGTRWDFPLL